MARLPSLRKSRTLQGIAADLRLVRGLLSPPHADPPAHPPVDPLAERDERIAAYLATHDVRRLQLGSRAHRRPGWLASDIDPKHPAVLAIDASRPLPFPDDSLDLVHAEHLIEHLRFGPGQRLLRECRRVLRPGGVLRLATPDLARLVAVYRGDAGPEGENYLDFACERWLSGRPYRHPGFLLNHNLRAWGHVFVYDEEMLTRSLHDAGLVDVTRCALGESAHPDLRDMERHLGSSPEARRAVGFETMVLEATSPPAGPSA